MLGLRQYLARFSSARKERPALPSGILTPLFAFVACILAPALPVRAIEIANDFSYGSQTRYAASRALATDFARFPVFQSVGLLLASDSEGNTGISTGTLLNSEWVLTAAHNWNPQRTSMQFLLGGVIYDALVPTITQHPLWLNAPPPLPSRQVSASQGWDVAVFKLATPVSGPLIYPKLYTKSDEMGKTGILLGAGMLGNGTTPWFDQSEDVLTEPWLVHAACNTIDRTTNQTASGYTGGVLSHDFDGASDPEQNTFGQAYLPGGDPWIWDGTGKITSLEVPGVITGNDSASSQFTEGTHILEGSGAPGDSGGPTFLEDGGVWKLAGITSAVANPWDYYNGGDGFRGLYGDVNVTTRVSAVAPWIYSVIPEPTTGALVLLALLGLLFATHRQKKTT